MPSNIFRSSKRFARASPFQNISISFSKYASGSSRTCTTLTRDIESFIQEITSRPVKYNFDTIDIERISQLKRILPIRQSSCSYLEDVKKGDELLPAFHLVLFRPKFMLKDLGKDGSATEYNAPSPYTRRMWAGGSIQWSNNNSLKIGDDVTQIVTIPKVEFKKDMIFVNQQLLIYPGIRSNSQSSKKNDDSWSIKEIRTHVFRKEPTFNTVHQIASSEKSTYSQKSSRTIQPIHSFKYIPDSTLLFLYSALTNNPHKVHYDYEWTIKEEGHEKPLVHGPLTATLLVELAGQLKPDKKIKEFKYRATNPMTIDREIRLSASRSTSKEGPLDTSTFELIAEQSSKIGMKAFASFH